MYLFCIQIPFQHYMILQYAEIMHFLEYLWPMNLQEQISKNSNYKHSII